MGPGNEGNMTMCNAVESFNSFYPWPVAYRIAGNFREVQIFAIFATHDQNAKIRTVKYEPRKFEHELLRELLNLWKLLHVHFVR